MGTAREEMHGFATRWIPRFEEWGYGQLFETMEFSDDCRALGFEGYHEMRIALAQANASVRRCLSALLPKRRGNRACNF